ncbi:hypothetical protein ACPWSR_15680 [Alloiococcus sp. CFN-8]|uniref:P-type ATPase n=1 Tax=Alloiococcus sp. CFN-8 TaxID=3416081 RepID=UPI003CEAFA89
MDYHRMTLKKVEDYLDTDIRRGLSNIEASYRIKLMKDSFVYGEFIYKAMSIAIKRISIIRVVSVIIMIVFIFRQGNTLHFLLGLMSIVITVVVRTLKYIKESKKISLKHIIKKKYVVIRDGKEQEVKGRNIVSGDLVFLNKGVYVPADIRIVYAENFKVDEFIFTGSHRPILKNNTRIIEEINSYLEMSNIAFMGSLVDRGEAYGIVVTDYRNSRLFNLVQGLEAKSMLPDKANKPILTMVLLLFAILSITMDLFTSFFANHRLIEGIIYNSTLLIITMPYFLCEEIFSYSLKKEYIKYGISFKNLKSIIKLREVREFYLNVEEALGYGGKSIESLYYDGEEVKPSLIEKESYTFKRLMEGLLLTYENHQRPIEDKSYEGLENQIIKSFSCMNNIFLEDIEGHFNHCYYLQDNLEGGLKGRVVKQMDNYRVYLKGEVSELISCCKSIMIEGLEKQITPSHIKAIREWNYNIVSKGHNTIAVGYRNFKYKPSPRDKVDSNIVFVGIISIKDILEKYNYELLNYLLRNNIGLSLFTEKNPTIYLKLWKELGLINEVSDLLSVAQIDYMEDDKLSEILSSYNIFSKINSTAKERIMKAKKEAECKTSITGRIYNDFTYLSYGYASIASGDDVLKDIVRTSDIWIKEDCLRKLLYLREEGSRDLYSFRRYQESVVLAFFLELVFIILFSYENLFFLNLVIIPIVALSLSIREREAPDEKDYNTSLVEYKSFAFPRLITISSLALISYLISSVLLEASNPNGALFLLLVALLISSVNYSYKYNLSSRKWVKGAVIFAVVLIMAFITIRLRLYGISNILFNILLALLYQLADLYLFKRT